MPEQANPEALAYHIQDIPAATGIPLRRLYEDLRAGRLTARKAGRRNIITRPELDRYLAALPTRGHTEPAAA
jgi:hypothetical protein